MAGDDKKTKVNPAPKLAAPAPEKASPAPKKETPSTDKSAAGTDSSKAEGGEKAAEPSTSYSRGEGQKPVSKAYRDNWNVIFGKKKKR
jgi:hypothetical protein